MKTNNCKDVEGRINEIYSILKEKYKEQIKNITVDLYGDGDDDYGYINIENCDYIIYILVSINYDNNNKIEYDMSTRNLHKKYSIYEDEYENKVTRKSLKGIITYIDKFMN